MVFLVPFDGTRLARAALARAAEFAERTDESVVVLSVVPDDPEYARGHGWLASDERFDRELVVERLRDRADDVAPAAEFRAVRPDGAEDPTSTLTTDVTRTIRRTAAELDVSVLFIGSENAGQAVAPLTSVGGPLSEGSRYDLHIVREVRE